MFRAPLVAMVVLVGGGSSVGAGDGAEAPQSLEWFLAGIVVDASPLAELMTYRECLEFLSKAASSKRKTTFRLDVDAWGEKNRKALDARIRLPEHPRILSIMTALRLATSRALDVADFDFRFGKDEVVITRPERTLDTKAFPVGDLVRQIDRILVVSQRTATNAEKANGTAVARLISETVPLRPFESMRMLNGTTLIVHGATSTRNEVEHIVNAYRRSLDLAVTMNARLYEVDSDVFEKRLAPVFGERNRTNAFAIAPADFDRTALQFLEKQKPIQTGEDEKWTPGIRSLFLSHHEWLKLEGEKKKPTAKRPEAKNGEAVVEEVQRLLQSPTRFGVPTPTIGFVGASFFATARPDAARRYLRIEIACEIDQPRPQRNFKFGDEKIGFEEVENPEGDSIATTATVTIPDGATILMRARYRVPSDGERERVRVIVAEPLIYIQSEVDFLRSQKQDPVSPSKQK